MAEEDEVDDGDVSVFKMIVVLLISLLWIANLSKNLLTSIDVA